MPTRSAAVSMRDRPAGRGPKYLEQSLSIQKDKRRAGLPLLVETMNDIAEAAIVAENQVREANEFYRLDSFIVSFTDYSIFSRYPVKCLGQLLLQFVDLSFGCQKQITRRCSAASRDIECLS